MGTRQTTFGKLERERAKRAKAAAKRARRQGRADTDIPEGGQPQTEAPSPAPQVSADSSARLLERLEELHVRYDRGEMKFLDFEAEKAEIMARLTEIPIDDLT